MQWRTDTFRIADLCRDAPFWNDALLPPMTTVIELLGNEVVVNGFPTQIPFMLHCVMCGQGEVNFSWEMTGPHEANGPAAPILSSEPQHIRLIPLGLRRQSGKKLAILGTATISKFIAPTIAVEGLYFVVAKLDGHEEMHVPLLVWHAT
jgi:hypothetical protein